MLKLNSYIYCEIIFYNKYGEKDKKFEMIISSNFVSSFN